MNPSVYELLRDRAALAPHAPVVLGLDRDAMSYAGCLRQVETTGGALAALGIGQTDRVAVVLPNGPEMAVCFLAVASIATCAPLNPAYRAQEFARYFDDLAPSALIVSAAEASPAREVAVARDIPILELAADPSGPAGAFRLSGARTAAQPRFAPAENVALVLHTSGTTSRPKMVPLSQANLCASADNIASSLQLSPADRCLCVMPLFHIHGLVGALLSTIASGGSIACPPGFMAPRFFDWVAAYRPTWYTAVPTIHRAVLGRAKQFSVPPATSLRFVRSCSSALPPQLMAEFETALGVPLIEAYGMTEASHQMASNPLPPGVRKPGSVGKPAGAEVAIMAGDGNLLGPAETGEIVVRGPGVTAGYANNPEANAASFVDGWFRTGDQGYIDADGYVFINGRIKEIINRGGDKIAPREVDDALLAHPMVADAVTFALPDARLGEDIGAAVVLRPVR